MLVNNKYQPIVDELEGSIASMETQIQDKNSEVGSLEVEVQSLQDEEEEKTGELDDLEEDYASVCVVLEEKQGVYDVISLELTDLESDVYPADGYCKFNMYGVSFDYPEDTELELVSTIGDYVDGSQFQIVGECETSIEFSFSWVTLPYVPGLIEGMMEFIEVSGSDLYDMTHRGRVNTTICGYHAISQGYEGVAEGDYEYGEYFVFYSDADNRAYVISIWGPSQEEYEQYGHIMDSFRLEA